MIQKEHIGPIALIVFAIALTVVGGYHTDKLFGGTTVIELTQSQQITWEKPVTDAQWAEDTKNEAIAYRSDKVLTQMLAAHIPKLAREQKAFEKYQACADCLYWEYREQFEANGMKDPELSTEARASAQTTFNQRQWSVEKLQQSVERMQKEMELRTKGFVVTDEKTTKQPLFGGSRQVRHIID